jgi:cytidylate kinase
MSTGGETLSVLPIKDLPIKEQIDILGEQLCHYPGKIAIDGPAASGKGTLVTGLTGVLKLESCPSGDMYRAVTYYLTEILKLDTAILDDNALSSYLVDFSIFFKNQADGKKHVIIPSESESVTEDVTDKLQNPVIGKRVSDIAKRNPVRDVIKKQQLDMLSKGKIVIEGRDMWEIAKNDANIVIYLHARDEVLIDREIQRQKQCGVTLTPEDAAIIVTKRNVDDNTRKRGKLLTFTEAQNAHVYDLIIDTSDMTPDEILRDVLLKLAIIKHE